MSLYLLLFLLFLLQFFYFPIGRSFFEGAKVYVFEISVAILLLLQLTSKEGISFGIYKKPLIVTSAVLIAITIYHLLFHQTATVLFGNEFRLQGTFLMWMLLLFAFLSTRVSIEEKTKSTFIAIILFVQLVCTLLFIGVGADRPVGTLGEPNALAASVIFFWPFLAFAWPKKKLFKVIAGLGIFSALLILFVTGSRSGIIALGVQLCFLAALAILKLQLPKKDVLKRTIALILALCVLLGSLALPFIGPRSEYEDRGEIWIAAVRAGAVNPILGTGFGNAEYELHRANVAIGNKLQGYYVDSAHNIFLDWYIQAGAVGVLILIIFLYQAFKTFIMRRETRNIVLLLGVITALSFNPASVVSLVALWWLIGKGLLDKKSD